MSHNSRRELAKFTDAELAERLERAWSLYEDVDKRRRSSSWFWFWRKRRTIELQLFYRALSVFRGSPGFRVIDACIRMFLGNYGLAPERPIFVSDTAIEVDDHISAIQAMTNEMKRRVKKKNRAAK